jgi:hypothetical protein
MQKHLSRIIAVFLLPCLIADPLRVAPLITTVRPLALFTQQALADQALQVENPLLTKLPKISVLKMEKPEKKKIPLIFYAKQLLLAESLHALTFLANDIHLARLRYHLELRENEWTATFFDPKDQNHVRWFRFENPNKLHATYRVISGERRLGEPIVVSVGYDYKRLRLLLSRFKLNFTWLKKNSVASGHSEVDKMLPSRQKRYAYPKIGGFAASIALGHAA